MRLELVIRLDYGSMTPWVTHDDEGLNAVAGPDALNLRTPVGLRGEGLATVAEFEVAEGDRIPFVLSWHASHDPAPPACDAFGALEETQAFWEEWSARSTYDGEWQDPVRTSLVALKALTYEPTGGIVAAPTTSLPEALGGVRNWDYRFCWVRDAALTLGALLHCGYGAEALAFRDWLLRATAGDPRQAQILYGLAGERRLPEEELDWLPGYEGSAPVRIGNAAAHQFQLDIYGELAEASFVGRAFAQSAGLDVGTVVSPSLQRRNHAYLSLLESLWQEPDEGIWEVRGPRRHFTHSKVMAWVAFDRAIRSFEDFGLEGPIDRWRQNRQEIHDEVCREAYDVERGSFTQSYGSRELDASLLLIPAVGFLPPDDERVRGTVDAVESDLLRDGVVCRYETGEAEGGVDGLVGREGAFLACSFWLADALATIGREADARALFETLLGLRNDLGLLAEMYDPDARRQVGNFPQAFTHLSLVNTAHELSKESQGGGLRAPSGVSE